MMTLAEFRAAPQGTLAPCQHCGSAVTLEFRPTNNGWQVVCAQQRQTDLFSGPTCPAPRSPWGNVYFVRQR